MVYLVQQQLPLCSAFTYFRGQLNNRFVFMKIVIKNTYMVTECFVMTIANAFSNILSIAWINSIFKNITLTSRSIIFTISIWKDTITKPSVCPIFSCFVWIENNSQLKSDHTKKINFKLECDILQ